MSLQTHSTPLVRLQRVSKNYREGDLVVPVLRDVDLEIPDGAFWAFMGPSGSGKSTLLNLISGLDKPSSGVVEFEGRRISEMNEGELAEWRAAHVGFVFQLYNLIPVLTAAENVELPLLLTTLSARERKRHVQAALRVVGLVNRASHRPAQLSGGEQQRVAIARAVVSDPKLLIADEPTGDLDKVSAEHVLDLLQALHRELRKTIVMVTHDPHAAERASAIHHLDKGTLS